MKNRVRRPNTHVRIYTAEELVQLQKDVEERNAFDAASVSEAKRREYELKAWDDEQHKLAQEAKEAQ